MEGDSILDSGQCCPYPGDTILLENPSIPKPSAALNGLKVVSKIGLECVLVGGGLFILGAGFIEAAAKFTHPTPAELNIDTIGVASGGLALGALVATFRDEIKEGLGNFFNSAFKRNHGAAAGRDLKNHNLGREV